ncbi:MAG: endolytic transglycosylase MltG [Woeseiaceae bacterium]|nr:endolytic transglycosylase MltG [Woeseiaceae bacterium]
MAILGVGLVAALAVHVDQIMDSPINVPDAGMDFEIPSGTPFAGVSRELENLGVITDGDILRWYARWTGQAADIQAGNYRLKSGSTARDLLDQFTSGDVRLYSVTIVEGWNHREMLKALHANPNITATMTDEDWPVLLAELGSDVTGPEGLFLPETYYFPLRATDRSILTEAYRLMQKVLNEEWSARADDTPVVSPYEALILASIVEKETARADERQRIAGVFARRLQKNMRLQTDPTVIYGIGPDFNGNLTRRDLRTDTPYNTYTRHGLPPTPIAMPGRAAINAALNPAAGEELYFVATGLGDGSHKFSVTHAQHEAAVQEYLRRLRQQRVKGGSQ